MRSGPIAALDYPRDRLELLVVDDGGDMPLEPLVARHGDGVRARVITQPNSGPSAARNTGLAAASGEVVAFLDDDCEPDPAWLRVLAEAWMATPQRGYGGRTENGQRGNLSAEVAQRIIDAGYAHLNRPGDARFLTSNNLLLPTPGLRDLGGFEPSLHTSEDRDLCDRWRLDGRRLEQVPAAVVRHHHLGGLAEFWRLHVAYARGARRFHVLHRERTGSLPAFEPSFYTRLLRRPGRPRVRSTVMLLIWIAASLYGYGAEAIRPSRSPRARSRPGR